MVDIDIDSMFEDADLSTGTTEEIKAEVKENVAIKEEPKKTEEAANINNEDLKVSFMKEVDSKLNNLTGNILDKITTLVSTAKANNASMEETAPKINNAVEKAQTYLEGLVSQGKIAPEALSMWEGIFDAMAVKKSGGKYENFDSFFKRTGDIEGSIDGLGKRTEGLTSTVVEREVRLAVSELKTDPKLNKHGAMLPTYSEWYDELFMDKFNEDKNYREDILSGMKSSNPKAFLRKLYLSEIGEIANDDSFIEGNKRLKTRMEERKMNASIPTGDQTVTVKRGKEEEKKKKSSQDIMFSTLNDMVGARLYN